MIKNLIALIALNPTAMLASQILLLTILELELACQNHLDVVAMMEATRVANVAMAKATKAANMNSVEMTTKSIKR